MENLKPCPFCGKSMLTIEFSDRSPNPFPFSARVLCLNCLASVGSGFEQTEHEAELKARTAWNRRVTPENKPHGLRTIYDTPDECPYCHEHLAREWSYCPECGRPTGENKPLTLEELREMDGKPVWIGEKDKRSHIGHYGLVDTVRERVIFNRSTYTTFKAVAGKTVYVRRPEAAP